MIRLIAIWLLLATLGWAGAARAQTVDLVWIAPDACPDATEVREELAQLLGRPLDAPSDQLLAVRGVVTRAATNWQVQVEVVGAGGPQERTVQGATCREVTAAAVLVVGLAVDPGSQGERSGPSPEVAAARGSTSSRPRRRPRPGGPPAWAFTWCGISSPAWP